MVRPIKGVLIASAVAWLCLAGLATNTASATPLTPSLVSVAPAGGGLFLWTYTADIADAERVETGDFFVLYDFFGFAGLPLGQPPAGWAFSSPFLGPVAPNTTPVDNPAVVNAVWTRTGGTISPPTTNLGTFSLLSNVGQPQSGGFFTAESTKNAPGDPTDGTPIGTIGRVPVPVPEPATALLVLAGPLFLFGAVKRGLSRRQA